MWPFRIAQKNVAPQMGPKPWPTLPSVGPANCWLGQSLAGPIVGPANNGMGVAVCHKGGWLAALPGAAALGLPGPLPLSLPAGGRGCLGAAGSGADCLPGLPAFTPSIAETLQSGASSRGRGQSSPGPGLVASGGN